MIRGTLTLGIVALLASSAALTGDGKTRPTFERMAPVTMKGKSLPFVEGVRVGDILYLSGQIGLDSSDAVPAGIDVQARRTMDRIGATLKSAGLGWDSVIRCLVMLDNMADWPAFNQVYATYFPSGNFPARSAMGADGLALGALVEVQCDAYSPGK